MKHEGRSSTAVPTCAIAVPQSRINNVVEVRGQNTSLLDQRKTIKLAKDENERSKKALLISRKARLFK